MGLAYTAVTAVTKWAQWQECWAGFSSPPLCSCCTQSVLVLSPLCLPSSWLGSALAEPSRAQTTGSTECHH